MDNQSVYSTVLFCHKSHEGYIGGISICDNHIKEALTKCFENVLDFSFHAEPESYQGSLLGLVKSKYRRITNHFDDDVYQGIINHIECPEKTIVFISHSTYGFLEKRLRKQYPTIRISTFFHNIEYNSWLKIWRRYKHKAILVRFLSYYVHEKLVSHYSDDIIVLNKRDELLFRKYYNKKKEVCILPFTLSDRCRDIKIVQHKNKLRLLFVGTYFYGNVEGVRRFVIGVMPSVDADFYVVGNKMDKLKDEMSPLANVHYIGRVTDEELDWYYRTSDILIAPIVEGGGMKTKVVEAIMYGCPVIGTKEAFEGFEEYLDFIGICSDNFSDYKQYISRFDEQRDVLYKKSLQARRVYEEHYNNERSVEILSSLYQKKN